MKSAKEIALEYFWKEYQDCYAIETDYNRTDMSIIYDFEDEFGGDVKEMENKINKLIESKCKETAKNVRHKACDIVLEIFSIEDSPIIKGMVNKANHNIMNIQEKDVAPK